MKKLIFLMVLTMILSVGCSKEDLTASDGLVDTVWEGMFEGVSMTLSFTTVSNFTLYQEFIDGSEVHSDTILGTYSYSYPNITLIVEGESVTGTMTENTLSLLSNGITILFTRK